MLTKLAARNVKRQIGNYLIYFITVSLTVALMFAINNFIFEEQLLARANNNDELKTALIAITVIVSLIVAFVLGYATSFMLKLRKREFGTYLTLGMTRGNILSLFLLESLMLCVVALGVGIALGLAFYQGVMAMVTNIMDIEYSFAAYSARGLLLTVGLVAGIFALSCVTSALYLKRVSIFKLLHADKKSEKGVRFPAMWLAVALVSFVAIAVSIVMMHSGVSDGIKNNGANGGNIKIVVAALMFAVAVIFFHIGLSKSVVNLMLHSEKYKSRGTNAFTLRKLSGKLSANSVLAGALAFLLAFAIIGANMSFTQQISSENILENDYPFDISAELDCEAPSVPFDTARAEIEKHAPIESVTEYGVYESGNSYMHGFTKWTGAHFEGLNDSFMTVSDFNALYGQKGYAPLADDGYTVISFDDYVTPSLFEDAPLELGGKTYSCIGTVKCPLLGYYFFVVVVPDECARFLTRELNGYAVTLATSRYDATALRDALSYERETGFGFYRACDYSMREYARLSMNASNAVFIVSALYLAFVFVFLAMAILALKTLSGISDDKAGYETLFRLGADRREQSRTLFRQTFAFFFLPFFVPLLMSIPAGFICHSVMSLAGLPVAAGKVIWAAAGIALTITAVYCLYFAVTYLIAKRNLVVGS